MPKGVHTGRRGPKRDPNALRRERDKYDDWIVLPPSGVDTAPTWPLIAPTVREDEVWQRLWTGKPQAHEWVRLGLEHEVAMYVRRFCEAERPRSPIILGTLIRQMADSLGLTPTGLRANQWLLEIESPEPVRRSTSVSSSRDRLTVIR